MKNKVKRLLLKNFHFVIVAVALFYRFGDYTEYRSRAEHKESNIPVVMKNIAKLKKRVELLDGFLSDLEESKKQLDDIKKEIEQVQQQLPEDIRDTDLLELFSQEANLMNIRDVFLKPKTENKKGIYITKEYELKATGTYLQFLVYFERLEKNPRLIDISEMEMVSSKSKDNRGRFQLLDLTAKIEVFRYDSVTKGNVDEQELKGKKKGS